MRKVLIKLLMVATRRVSCCYNLMARDPKKMALFREKTSYLEAEISSKFLPDSVVNGVEIKQLQLFLGVAAGRCILGGSLIPIRDKRARFMSERR